MDSKKRNLLNIVRDWLKEMGFSPSNINQDQGRFTILERFDDIDFEIVVRPIDEITVEFVAAYHIIPNGNDAACREWKDNILKRRWGDAALNLSDDKLYIVIWKHFRLSDSPHVDKGRLFFVMYSIREYFRCWHYDGEFANILGLNFPDINDTGL